MPAHVLRQPRRHPVGELWRLGGDLVCGLVVEGYEGSWRTDVIAMALPQRKAAGLVLPTVRLEEAIDCQDHLTDQLGVPVEPFAQDSVEVALIGWKESEEVISSCVFKEEAALCDTEAPIAILFGTGSWGNRDVGRV